MMQAPFKSRAAAAKYHAVLDAKVRTVKNSDRNFSKLVHFGRAAQALFQEFHVLYGQPLMYGDDMNTVQVGHPMVSRFHRNRIFFAKAR